MPGAAKSRRRIKLGKREDIQHSSLRGHFRKIADGIHETKGGGRVARIQPAGDDGADPSADAGENGDVLLAIGTLERNGLADDPGAGLELPQDVPATRIYRFEPAFERAVEDKIAGRGDSTAPYGEFLL